MDASTNNTTTWLFALLSIIAIGYGFFEWMNVQSDPAMEEVQQIAEDAVHEASENFQQFVFDYTSEATSFTEDVRTQIESGATKEQISNTIVPNYSFWGILITRDSTKWLWNDFAPDHFVNDSSTSAGSIYVSIGRENNVGFLYSIIPFFIEDSSKVTRYDVYTRVKLLQENVLNFGNNLEINPEALFSKSDTYPVSFNLNGVTDRKTLARSILSTASSDSLGEIIAEQNDLDEFKIQRDYAVGIWRALFLVVIFLLMVVLVFSLSKNLPTKWAVLFEISSAIILWLLIHFLSSKVQITHPSFSFFANKTLFGYLVNSTFSVLISFSISRVLLNPKNRSITLNSTSLNALSFFGSLISGWFISYYLVNSSTTITNSEVNVMDLALYPSLSTFVFYISSGFFFASITALSIIFFRYLLSQDTKKIPGIIISFLVGSSIFFFVAKFFIYTTNFDAWIPLISSLYLVLVFVLSFFWSRKKLALQSSSKLRLVIFISYIATCFVYIAYSSGNTFRQNERMQEAAQPFLDEGSNEVESITIQLLGNLNASLSENSLTQNTASLEELVEGYIRPDWLRYTISVQLIDTVGSLISDYTTSLSPPQWSTEFRIQDLVIPFEDEQIRRSNLRPVLRYRPINTINASYSDFIRGWIPIFENSESEKITGWILCSVYEEVPQLEKPLRAVLSLKKEDAWQETFSVTEYQNGILLRQSIIGIPLDIPGPTALVDEVVARVNADSIYTTSFVSGSNEIKELYINKSNGGIVRVATIRMSFNNHVFSFLRLFMVIVFGGIILLFILSKVNNRNLLGSSRRFKDRLIDRLIFASATCLIALVAASYYVLTLQNEQEVKTQLFNRLENLTSSLEEDYAGIEISPEELQRIASVLDIDASLFVSGSLTNSTTPQIFNQHLLSSNIPWDVFSNITTFKSNEELKVVSFDDQQMMIGYMPWMSDNNTIAGIAAIPTFLKAPQFYDRLLSTISYLIAFYALIFGLLMLGVGYITAQLTSPLEEIREALKDLSEGDFNTRLPVRSKDEIGTLTRAYNEMTRRLKTALDELAQTEREAAWKEMAQQIAHEIKNPLTPMKLNLQHLERQVELAKENGPEQDQRVAKITTSMIEQIDALNKIASDFSTFAKPIQQEFKKLDINALIQSVGEMYELDKHFSLDIHTTNKPLWVNGAKEELRRVFVNLIKNASEAVSQDGKISINTKFNSKKRKAQIEVSDNGQGISQEDQKNIFMPNFSTKTSGTGLGLAITKKIIEEHNGEIAFQSTLGQGTTFTIILPLGK
ncbi:MAG: HAMP domain-containing protein [Balneola sp.]|nr:MAG: HAMP domain-containing protein [Balneola sp.]